MMIGNVQLPSGVFPQFGMYDIIVHGQEKKNFLLQETLQYNVMFGAYEVVSQPEYQIIHSMLPSFKCQLNK